MPSTCIYGCLSCRQSCRPSHWSHLSELTLTSLPQLSLPAQRELVACNLDRAELGDTICIAVFRALQAHVASFTSPTVTLMLCDWCVWVGTSRGDQLCFSAVFLTIGNQWQISCLATTYGLTTFLVHHFPPPSLPSHPSPPLPSPPLPSPPLPSPPL